MWMLGNFILLDKKYSHISLRGRIFLSPMETILVILNELEFLESLVKLA